MAAFVFPVAAARILGKGVELLRGIADKGSYDMLTYQLMAGKGFTAITEWWPLTCAVSADRSLFVHGVKQRSL